MVRNIEQDGEVVSERIRKRQVADAILLEMFSLDELPDQSMTADEQYAIGRRIACGNHAAKQVYIIRRLRYAMMIALDLEREQTNASSLSLEDHFQNVIESMQNRLDEYSSQSDKDFISHMGWVFTPAERAYHYEATTIRFPTRVHVAASKVEEFITQHKKETGVEPSLEEIAASLRVGKQKAKEFREDRWRIDEGVISLESLSRQLQAPDKDENLPVQQETHAALNKLPYRQRRVLQLRFGLGGEEPMSLQKIGDIFNLSYEYIRRVEVKALERLAALMESQESFRTLQLVRRD